MLAANIKKIFFFIAYLVWSYFVLLYVENNLIYFDMQTQNVKLQSSIFINIFKILYIQHILLNLFCILIILLTLYISPVMADCSFSLRAVCMLIEQRASSALSTLNTTALADHCSGCVFTVCVCSRAAANYFYCQLIYRLFFRLVN